MSAKSVAIAAAAMAGLFSGATALVGCQGHSGSGGTVAPDASAKHSCKGQNACKGLGGCKTGDNGCKGQNSCKGKGGCKAE